MSQSAAGAPRSRLRRPASNGGTNTDTAKISVSESVKQQFDEVHAQTTTDEIRQTVAAANPAYVRVSGGITKETGRKFEFIRVDVSIEIPCNPTPEDVEATYQEATEFVDTKLTERLEELNRALA